MQETSIPKADILVVDDTPDNLRLLVRMLSDQGYHVRPIPDGPQALQAARSKPPDLILLDICMPRMDGYEVCRQLKADKRVRGVPVVFLSALGETEDKVRAFAAGGVDYITKPYQVDEVLARVETHLSLRALQKQLQGAVRKLLRANAELEQRNAELDAFAHTVAHDLKSPLGIVASYAGFLAANCETMSVDRIVEAAQVTARGAHKMLEIVDDLLLLARARGEEVQVSVLDMGHIVGQVLERLGEQTRETQARVVVPATWPEAVGYGPWIEEVWANYLSNALKYGGSPPCIELGAAPGSEGDGRPGFVRFWVRDHGPGIAQEDQQALFTEFTQLHRRRAQGHGLGLSIVRRIVERLQGRVGVESAPGQGSTFYFALPAAEGGTPQAATASSTGE